MDIHTFGLSGDTIGGLERLHTWATPEPRPKGARYSTVPSYRGLEADVVLVTDVDDLFSSKDLASIYVGTW